MAFFCKHACKEQSVNIDLAPCFNQCMFADTETGAPLDQLFRDGFGLCADVAGSTAQGRAIDSSFCVSRFATNSAFGGISVYAE
jgi:hypothetical protein